jgi:hypothetical protein
MRGGSFAVGAAGLVVGAGLLLAPAPRPAYLPDPALTPGDVVPLDAPAVCDRGYAGRARHVAEARKREVFRAYRLDWKDRDRYEVDHLIPLAVGGANSPSNLWPQPWDGPFGAREKDRLEVRMRSLLCRGQVTLREAQDAFRTDWTRAYRAQGLDKPRLAAIGPAEPEPDAEGFEPDDDPR